MSQQTNRTSQKKQATAGNNPNSKQTRETQGISQENNRNKSSTRDNKPQGTTPSRTSKDLASNMQSIKATARKEQSEKHNQNRQQANQQASTINKLNKTASKKHPAPPWKPILTNRNKENKHKKTRPAE
jgi:hypothetical protein